jgi:hypothetical protein
MSNEVILCVAPRDDGGPVTRYRAKMIIAGPVDQLVNERLIDLQSNDKLMK